MARRRAKCAARYWIRMVEELFPVFGSGVLEETVALLSKAPDFFRVVWIVTVADAPELREPIVQVTVRF